MDDRSWFERSWQPSNERWTSTHLTTKTATVGSRLIRFSTHCTANGAGMTDDAWANFIASIDP